MNQNKHNEQELDQEKYTWGLPEEEIEERFSHAVDLARAESIANGKPVMYFDEEKGMNYIQYPDGTKEYQEAGDKI